MPNLRVLVVGAGPCGLAALKEMKEAGFDAMAVDARSNFGGVFSPDSGVTYEQLHLTTNNMFMAFSDFPPKDDVIKYWSKSEYYAYLSQYVEHFDLRKFIELETTVQKASLGDDKKWTVSTMTSKGQSTTRTCDYLIVATGANQKPHIPEVFEGFSGDIMHSSDYHSSKQVSGKKILVVGHGESATDVAVSAVNTAESVAMWARRGPNCAPRFLSDMINDTHYNEVAYMSNPGDCLPKNILDIATTSRIVRNLPLGVWSFALHGLMADIKAAHGPMTTACVVADLCELAYKNAYYSSDMATAPTKSLGLCTAAASGKLDLVVAPDVAFKGTKATFNKPSYFGADFADSNTVEIEADLIVACTGFHTSFDWLDVANLEVNPRSWFKHAFPPSLAPYLGFVGYARPHQGGIPQCAEMVARYMAQILLGNCQLPDNYAHLAKLEGDSERACFLGSPNYNVLVDYAGFMNSVARLAGCEIKTPYSPSDMVKYWTFPMWPCFFRTQGAGANPEACQVVLDKFDTYDALAPMPLVGLEVLFTWIMPFVNLFAYCSNISTSLPRGYKFRVSKFNLMHGNSVRLVDILDAGSQFGAAILITLHGVKSLLKSSPTKKVKSL